MFTCYVVVAKSFLRSDCELSHSVGDPYSFCGSFTRSRHIWQSYGDRIWLPYFMINRQDEKVAPVALPEP